MFAMVLCALVLPNLTTRQGQVDVGSVRGKLARIDFLGAIFLGSGLLFILLPLRIAGQKVPWTSPVVPSLFATGAALLALFIVTETSWAKEPIFPLRLLRNRDVVFSYLIMACQTAAQVGVCSLNLDIIVGVKLFTRNLDDGFRPTLFPSYPEVIKHRRWGSSDASCHRQHHWRSIDWGLDPEVSKFLCHRLD